METTIVKEIHWISA